VLARSASEARSLREPAALQSNGITIVKRRNIKKRKRGVKPWRTGHHRIHADTFRRFVPAVVEFVEQSLFFDDARCAPVGTVADPWGLLQN
jgi:hypothetical protein